MTSTFIIVSILEVAVAALIITGFVFEKKLIDFEEKLENALAKKIAHFLCTNKYTKAHFVKEKDRSASQRSQDCVRARDCLSDPRQKGQQSCLTFFRNRISLTALRLAGRSFFTFERSYEPSAAAAVVAAASAVRSSGNAIIAAAARVTEQKDDDKENAPVV